MITREDFQKPALRNVHRLVFLFRLWPADPADIDVQRALRLIKEKPDTNETHLSTKCVRL